MVLKFLKHNFQPGLLNGILADLQETSLKGEFKTLIINAYA